ncbi:phosphoesterase [Xanthomonas phage Xoo-sp13]|nr:phosphoesterase [Xanthomonas phage Xoo-sp13]
MNEGLIKAWNEVVKPQDTVWQLGDFTFLSNMEKVVDVLSRLNGHKHAVFGNHCHLLKKNREFLVERGLFESMYERKVLSVDKQKIVLDHFPGRSWNYSAHGGWQLHGHCHGTMEPYGKSVDVGVDAPFVLGYAPYRPLAYEEVKSFMDSRKQVNEFAK